MLQMQFHHRKVVKTGENVLLSLLEKSPALTVPLFPSFCLYFPFCLPLSPTNHQHHSPLPKVPPLSAVFPPPAFDQAMR